MSEPVIIGCGDIGCRVGEKLVETGKLPVGVVRTVESCEHLLAFGIRPYRANLDAANSLKGLATENAVVYHFAPPPPDGEADIRMQNFLEYCATLPPQKIIYISTSGVYGDCGGDWVSEDRPPDPQTGRARRRLHAERQLLEFAGSSGTDVVILRVGGIYGPGRLPLSRIPSMTVICPEEAPYSNRIHSYDLAAVCLAAAERGRSGSVYNVADNNPTSMTDYMYSVADMAGIDRPQCIPMSQARNRLTPGMLSFIQESRRMDTNKMRNELGVSLKYPSLKEGLPGCF